MQVVNAINMGNPNWSKMGHLIDGIKEDLGKLRSWMVEHVKRAANSTAYILARETFSCIIDRVWVKKNSTFEYMLL
jgi:hypothetical protein